MADWLYLDSPSLIYRAFFALPTTIRDPSGRPVNALRGFIDMLARLVTDRRPTAVVATFDADWRPAWRVSAYAGYKATRKDDPEELPPQFDWIQEMLDAFGIERTEAPGLEADDALATLAARISGRDRSWIVTGDRDLLALVRDPWVQVLFTVKGVSELAVFDEAAVESKYGVAPSQYTDFAILRGDPSDGLPGVAGVGPVRAAKLLATHGSIEAILENVASLPRAQAAAFENARAYLAAMRKVVPMRTDAPLRSTTPRSPDRARVEKLAAAYGVATPAQRLLDALTARST